MVEQEVSMCCLVFSFVDILICLHGCGDGSIMGMEAMVFDYVCFFLVGELHSC